MKSLIQYFTITTKLWNKKKQVINLWKSLNPHTGQEAAKMSTSNCQYQSSWKAVRQGCWRGRPKNARGSNRASRCYVEYGLFVHRTSFVHRIFQVGLTVRWREVQYFCFLSYQSSNYSISAREARRRKLCWSFTELKKNSFEKCKYARLNKTNHRALETFLDVVNHQICKIYHSECNSPEDRIKLQKILFENCYPARPAPLLAKISMFSFLKSIIWPGRRRYCQTTGLLVTESCKEIFKPYFFYKKSVFNSNQHIFRVTPTRLQSMNTGPYRTDRVALMAIHNTHTQFHHTGRHEKQDQRITRHEL